MCARGYLRRRASSRAPSDIYTNCYRISTVFLDVLANAKFSSRGNTTTHASLSLSLSLSVCLWASSRFHKTLLGVQVARCARIRRLLLATCSKSARELLANLRAETAARNFTNATPLCKHGLAIVRKSFLDLSYIFIVKCLL